MKRDFPPNYGNDYKEQWKEGDFHVGDAVECGFDNPDFGIISFTSGDYMSVCTACGSGTDELPHRDINVVISSVVPVRKLEEHEYTKLDAQLRKGCKTKELIKNGRVEDLDHMIIYMKRLGNRY